MPGGNRTRPVLGPCSKGPFGDKESIKIELTKTANRIGHSPTYREMDICLAKTCVYHYGSFNKAKIIAGLKTYKNIWTKEDMEYLENHYHNMSNLNMSQNINHSVNSILHKAKEMGLTKDKEFVRYVTSPTHIKKGQHLSLKNEFTSGKTKGKNNPFYGKHHTKESKRKLREARKRQRTPRYKTNPENKVLDAINEYNLPYKFVGDGKIWINNLNPDFIQCNGKKNIIEVFGDYWHTKEGISWSKTEDGRKEIFKEYGYKTLIFWEHDINSMSISQIADIINEFEGGGIV